MLNSLLANLVLILHALFILFVIAGGLLVLRWHRLIWLHIPCVLWAILLELNHWICPLTPLENYLRSKAGNGSYTGGFIEHYLTGFIYPNWLTAEIQILLGLMVALLNLIIYSLLIVQWRKTVVNQRQR